MQETKLLITAEELAALLGISKRTVWRLKSEGRLPEPVRLARSVRWRYNEVVEWIDNGCPAQMP